ncbi:MAG: helix-turn-helix transcriptional regulator [Deltaproteobacteria bacterium]|nr:helix-turn-helix transcriptional regulator [Deltaproteobacteria bacterium]
MAAVDALLAAEPPTRRERRRLEVRDRIVDAALALFESQGYESTTVAEIVRRSDIAYGTFFNHFPSKLHLLREVADHSMRDLFENVEEVRKQPGDFAAHLVLLFERSAERTLEKGPQMRELIGAMMALAFPETAGNDDRRIRQAFGRVLEDGVDRGELRRDVDLETLLEVVVGAWYSMFFSWVHFEDYPLRERATKAARFLAQTLIRGDGEQGLVAPARVDARRMEVSHGH